MLEVDFPTMADEPDSEFSWRYALCPLDAKAADFGPFADIVRLWQQRRRHSGRLPRRRDLDFYDLTKWLGRIFIAKVEREPFRVRFVLWGTQLAEWWNVDYTGKLLGEASIDPEVWNSVELKYFEAMDREPFIGIASGYLEQHDRPHIKVLGVDLPLSDGQGLSHVLSAHITIDADQTLYDVIPRCPVQTYFSLDTDGGAQR